jgi:biotin carboxyl carrier protein
MLRRFSIKVAARDHLVEIDNQRVATVDGRSLALEAAAVEPGVYLLREGPAQTVVYVDGSPPKLTLTVRRPGRDPVSVPVEVADARSAQVAALARASGGAAAGPARVRSPIPGRVVKVLVRAGDRVAASQPVVVLEAMKMENELRAPRAGTIQEICCSEGTAVEAGQDLAILGP